MINGEATPDEAKRSGSGLVLRAPSALFSTTLYSSYRGGAPESAVSKHKPAPNLLAISFIAVSGSHAGFHVKAIHMGPDYPRWRRPRTYHHGNLKEVLLEAARKLIEQHGPIGFSLTEAARLAGVSPAAPYRHFRDRDALLAEVARNGFERFAAKLDAAWNNGVPTPLSAFETLGRAYLAFAREEPASYAVMFEARLGPGEDAQLKVAADRAFDVLQRAAASLCQTLPPDRRPPVRMMSLHVWALSHGVADLFVQERPGAAKLPLSPEEIVESAMLIYLRGLGILPSDAVAGSP